MVELGVPNLADAIWLYGASEEEIAAQIRAPRHGVMPAWQDRLGETTVKELAVYVHSLGGGQ
jgi:cytochrome c oxidase cbb3-type subunit III